MTKRQDYKHEPIAVIGMACIFPQAPDVETFWQNILNKVNAIGDPLPAWEAERYMDAGYVSTQKGGYLRDLFRFNPTEFGIMPNSIDGGEPDQYLALQVAKRALLDAGEQYLDKDYDHRDTGIILGHSPHFHRGQINGAQHHVCIDQTLDILKAVMGVSADQEEKLRKIFKEQLPPFNADMCPSMVPNVMTGRIANRLNFTGPNYMVDAACASSLLAVNAAIEELRSGSSRIMLAGGVNASLPAEVSVIFTLLDALSDSGKVRPFSTGSDGTLLGEGLGVVVLKRLSDALADGDRIYSLVHGVGQSSDGKGYSLLAPSEKGETLAIQRTYDATGIDPETVTLVEAHGTGIALGDRTEVASLTNIFGKKRKGEQGAIAMGSVKSMISHCIPAAGMASFIKTSLALYHKILPPTLCEDVNPALGIDKTPFFVNTEAMPWIHPLEDATHARRAAINSFGFGGVNAHAVLEEAPKNAPKPLKCSPWSAEICVVTGKDVGEVKEKLACLKRFAEAREDVKLADIAYTLWNEVGNGTHKLAMVAKDRADLLKKIDQAVKKIDKGETSFGGRGGVFYSSVPVEGKLAFMFPGEGSQYMGMLRDLALHFDVVREWFDFWHALYGEVRGSTRTDLVFPTESELTDEKRAALDARLHEMEAGSEAVWVADQAMFALLTELGVQPDVMVGHSSGESAALVAAHAVPWKDKAQLAEFVRRINTVAKIVEQKGGIATGALMAIALMSKEQIEKHLAKTGIVIAMENCPTQTIVYGDKAAVKALSAKLAAEGAICEMLPFDRGYHTAAFAPMQKAFMKYYDEIGLGAPKLPLYSCATAKLFPKNKKAVQELAAEQWTVTVRFSDTIRAMADDGVGVFVEVGPGGKLASFAEQILKGRDALVMASNLESQPGLQQLLSLMAMLYVNGKATPEKLFAGRKVASVDFSTLEMPKPFGVFLDNSIPRLRATPELVEVLTGGGAQGWAGPSPGAQSAPPSPEGRGLEDPYPEYRPFFTEIVEVSESHFVGLSRLNVHEDRFLQDHILSGAVSDHEHLKGLACVPLMVSLEIMAEAAAVVAKSIDVRAIEDVRTFDWIALDHEEVVLEVRAAQEDDGRVFAEIFNHGKLVVSAHYEFGVQALQLTEALPDIQYRDEPYRWSGEYEMYSAGMFHGPIFQTVRRIKGWSEQGIDAELSRAGLEGFFRDGETPRLVLNPALMDSLNQLTAFWLAQQIGPDFNNFPTSVERMEFHAPCPQDVDGLHSRARKSPSRTGAGDGHWDFECYQGDQLLIRIKNLQNIFFEVPNAFYQCRMSPLNGWLGAPTSDGAWQLAHLPMEFCGKSNGMFLRALAYGSLDAEERHEWRALNGSPVSKARWLFDRLCVKEAVRYAIYQQTGELLYPSDIHVSVTEQGVLVDGWWREAIDAPEVVLQGGDGVSSAEVMNAGAAVAASAG